jgi:hypothetical protein
MRHTAVAGLVVAVVVLSGLPGVRFALRGTVYEGDPEALAPGVRVAVRYRIVGDSRPVADRVRVLQGAIAP